MKVMNPKQLLGLFLVVIIVFIAGCTQTQPVQKEYVCSNKIVVSNPSECPQLTVEVGKTSNIDCVSDADCPESNSNWITQKDGYTQVKWGCDFNINRCVVKNSILAECTEVKPCTYGQCFNGVCK